MGDHPIIEAIEQKFLANPEAYEDVPMAVCDRWMATRAVLKDVLRGRHLYDDLTDIYALAAEKWTDPLLFAAYELATLQYWFYVVLHNNRLIRKHVQEWNATMVFAWRTRLAERKRTTLPWRRAYEEGDTIFTPHRPPGGTGALPWQH